MVTKQISKEVDCALIQAAGALTRTYHRNKAMTALEKDIADIEYNPEIPAEELSKRTVEARNRHNSLEEVLKSYGEVLEGLRAKFRDGTFSAE
ncbi:hypothetical protein NKW54_04535 [Acetobacter cerevisiae]|uniref:Uncharacterized protein n=1 Tax=Acetobacter cerevisiae TaxID=178900 RepID=A0ABT1EPQ3_9PROT|nr:hypothetical protein [Acetobacter cerevisiae]MCP1245204.1 hypothetical protein [Acetobacter cerevisiae]MCP1254569.1 hypothetical protein [Acetobacter cerevisiae]